MAVAARRTKASPEIGERLKNSPLVEAVCEFRFAPDSQWDWTIPGLLFEHIRDEFSERSELRSLSVSVQQAGADLAPPVLIDTGPERVQLKRPDGSAMVQVGPRLLAINHLRPYADWEAFRALILNIYRTYRDISLTDRPSRIGLRYINQITRDGRQVNEILTLRPTLVGKLNRPIANFYQRYEFSHEKPKGILIHQSGLQEMDGEPVITVDLDFFSESVAHLRKDKTVTNWLNQAHDRVEESFIDSLTQELYERLNRGAE